MRQKGCGNASDDARGQIEKGDGCLFIRVMNAHDVRLDRVVNADVQTGVGSVTKNGGNQPRKEAPFVLLHHVLAGVIDGVVRYLIVLHSTHDRCG